jgi:hypothetical protein
MARPARFRPQRPRRRCRRQRSPQSSAHAHVARRPARLLDERNRHQLERPTRLPARSRQQQAHLGLPEDVSVLVLPQICHLDRSQTASSFGVAERPAVLPALPLHLQEARSKSSAKPMQISAQHPSAPHALPPTPARPLPLHAPRSQTQPHTGSAAATHPAPAFRDETAQTLLYPKSPP